jgi:cobalamin biosynthesis protein CobD/CbiB
MIELRERKWIRMHNYRYGIVLPLCWLGGATLLFLTIESKSPSLAVLTACIAVYMYHIATKELR